MRNSTSRMGLVLLASLLLTTARCGPVDPGEDNTCGISNANKGMPMAAMAYNLKKYLKFSQKRVETAAKSAQKHLLQLLALVRLIIKPNPTF